MPVRVAGVRRHPSSRRKTVALAVALRRQADSGGEQALGTESRIDAVEGGHALHQQERGHQRRARKAHLHGDQQRLQPALARSPIPPRPCGKAGLPASRRNSGRTGSTPKSTPAAAAITRANANTRKSSVTGTAAASSAGGAALSAAERRQTHAQGRRSSRQRGQQRLHQQLRRYAARDARSAKRTAASRCRAAARPSHSSAVLTRPSSKRIKLAPLTA